LSGGRGGEGRGGEGEGEGLGERKRECESASVCVSVTCVGECVVSMGRSSGASAVQPCHSSAEAGGGSGLVS